MERYKSKFEEAKDLKSILDNEISNIVEKYAKTNLETFKKEFLKSFFFQKDIEKVISFSFTSIEKENEDYIALFKIEIENIENKSKSIVTMRVNLMNNSFSYII